MHSDQPLLPGAVEPGALAALPMPSGASGHDLQQYWHVLRKRRVAVGLTCLVVVVTTVVASFLVRPVYRAEATIQIERDNPNILSFQEILQVDSRQDDFYQTQYILLQSRSLLRRVIEQLKLYEHPEFVKALPPGQARTSPQQPWDLRLIDVAEKRVSVQPIRRSRLVRIAVDTHYPDLSAAIANEVASAYIDMNLQNKFETTDAATQFLSTQIEALKREIEEDKKRLQEYAGKSKILSLDDKQNITVQRLTDLNSAFTKAQSDRIEAESHFVALLKAVGLSDLPKGGLNESAPPSSDLDLGRVPEVANNTLVQTLRASRAQLQARYAELGEKFKPEWPEMVRLHEQMADLGRQVGAEEWRIVAGLLKRADSDYKGALGREKLLGSELEGQKEAVTEMNSSAILYNTLKAEIDNKSELLDSLLKRKNETDVSARLSGLKSSNIRIVDEAEPPRSAFRPDKRMNAILALVLGSLLGMGVAFFLEYLDNTIKSVDDVERYAGLPSLGVIPRFVAAVGARAAIGDGAGGVTAAAGPSNQLVTLDNARTAVAEAYRSLRTSILLSSAGSPPRVLLVTSSQPSEGKTTTVVNTAIALAQAGKKVLLVDADLRKPRCHRLLGRKNGAGLTTFLTGTGPLQELIQPTAVRGLFLLPSGPIPPNPSELLGSARVQTLMRLIPAEVDHILFDSPPVLTVTDATLLAAAVDGVVLVVRAGQVPRELLRRAQKQLRDVKAKVVGVVLNSVDARSADYYYYSYNQYGYGDEVA